MRIADAPHPDELIIALAAAAQGRPQAAARAAVETSSRPQCPSRWSCSCTAWVWIAGLLGDLFERAAARTSSTCWRSTCSGTANAPAANGTTLSDLADDVADGGRRATHGPAHLVGFSLGALVAQHLARFGPNWCASLTSVSSVCRRTESERTAVLGRLAVAEADFPAICEASLGRWSRNGTDPELVAGTRTTLLANDLAWYLNCYRVFATADAEIGPELPRIDVPALAITGGLDPGSTPDITPAAGRGVAGLPRRRGARCPDMLPVQQPHEFVTSLTTFIRERGHAESPPSHFSVAPRTKSCASAVARARLGRRLLGCRKAAAFQFSKEVSATYGRRAAAVPCILFARNALQVDVRPAQDHATWTIRLREDEIAHPASRQGRGQKAEGSEFGARIDPNRLCSIAKSREDAIELRWRRKFPVQGAPVRNQNRIRTNPAASSIAARSARLSSGSP